MATAPQYLPPTTQQQRARKARLEAIRKNSELPRVRVEPTKEKYRILKHPNGMAFRAEGSVEWPLDKFTQRRIADGSVKVVEQQKASATVEQKTEEHVEEQPRGRGRTRSE